MAICLPLWKVRDAQRLKGPSAVAKENERNKPRVLHLFACHTPARVFTHYFLFNLKGREREAGTDIFYQLVHSPDVTDNQSWAGMSLDTRNSI